MAARHSMHRLSRLYQQFPFDEGTTFESLEDMRFGRTIDQEDEAYDKPPRDRSDSSSSEDTSTDDIDGSGKTGSLDAIVAKEDAQPLSLSFRDLEYSVKVKSKAAEGFNGFVNSIRTCSNPFRKESKTLLHKMSGHFLPGRLVAIMGPSGAGKSTFMNLLSGRVRNGAISGEVLVNGQRLSRSSFKALSAYVMQDDALLGNLTPRELLRYAARLRLPRSMSKREKYARVEELIERLNLTKCADTRVGYAGLEKGISGGERKRTSIALELLTSPMLIFLDEPTSGLDSSTALSLVRHLKALAAEGRTILCTIHQPSSEMGLLFDDVFWLCGGQLLYSGPMRSSPRYFSEAGFPCPRLANPTDHIMSILSRDETESQDELDERLAVLAERYTAHNNIVSMEDHAKLHDLDLTAEPSIPKKGASFIMQFWILLWRALRQRVRDPGNTYQRLTENIVIAVFSGLMFLDLGDDQDGIRDRVGVMFLMLIFSVFATGNAVLYIFPQERASFLREYANGSFGVGPYYWAKSLADLPFNVLFPIIFTTIAYWMVGLRADAGAFFICLAVIVIVCNIAQSLGLLVSVGLDLQQAITLFPVIVTPSMLVGGLYLSVENIPDYFIWLKYLSFFFYSFMVLLINEFDGEEYHCGDLPENVTCPLMTGDQVIDSYGFEDYEIWMGFLGMILLYAMFRLLAYGALWILAHRKAAA